jgi:type 1 fimbriae regulatory protein FimB
MRTSALTPSELLRLLSAAQRRTRDWCMILIAYRHGLRTSEVCALRLSDVRNGCLRVQRVKRSLRTLQPLYEHPDEPLLDEVAALRSWLAIRPNDGSGFLFTSQKGGRLDRTQFFRMFQAVAKKTRLPPYKRHPRVLKYSLAAHLVEQRVDISFIHGILGHRSVNSTLQYVKVPQRKHLSAERLLPLVFTPTRSARH